MQYAYAGGSTAMVGAIIDSGITHMVASSTVASLMAEMLGVRVQCGLCTPSPNLAGLRRRSMSLMSRRFF